MFPGGKGGRCVGPTTLPLSCADCLEIWELPTSWNPQGLSRPVMGLLYLLYTTLTQLQVRVLPTQLFYMVLYRIFKSYGPCGKWVPVTTAWRVLGLRMEERPPIWRLAANILNKQSRTADTGWSSSLGFGRGANNSSP
jgi:hypothetical protein